MKMLNKAKKGLTGIGLFLITLHSKVFASASDALLDVMAPEYGVERPIQNNVTEPSNDLKLLPIFLVLLIGVIGSIVYFKKSKGLTKKKVLVTILIMLDTVLLCFLIFLMIND